MILAMVRHGQTHYNEKRLIQGRIDIPLNAYGKVQAKDVSKNIKKRSETYDQIISSPLSRALETAYIVSKDLNMDKPIHVIQRFVERNFNLLDGKSVDEGMPLVRQKGYTHPGYEDDQMLMSRVIPEVFKLEQTYHDQSVLCITHSHVIKALLVYVDPNQFSFATYVLDNCDILYFEVKNQTIKFLKHEKTTKI